MKKIQSQKGITLISLIAYIIFTLIVLGILGTITANFRKNISGMNVQSVQDTEFDKLNLQLLRETKNEENEINESESNANKIVFSNGNIYTYDAEEQTVYLNDSIKVAEHIESCDFAIKKISNKQRLTATVQINGAKRITEYILLKQITIAGTRVNENTEYTIDGKTAIIPAGFTVSGILNETTIDEGLVIYDIPSSVDTSSENFWTETVTIGDQTYPKVQTEYNQFVWVPVETAYVKASDLEKIISDSNGGITTEKAAMQSLVDNGTYPMAVQLANGTDYRGILYNFSAGTNGVKIEVMDFSTTADYNDGSVTYNREPAKLSSTNASSVDQEKEPALDLQTEYNNIVKSIASQKGFWVARYELSYNTKGESKRGKTVATAEDTNTNQWYGLYTACQGMYQSSEITGMKSSMIYGSEWDQIMIWMKDVKNTQDNTKYYILDSSYMGNYNTETGGTGSRQVTGYLEKYSVKKVFDLGGNLCDWTTEASSTYDRVLRGSDYGNSGSSSPASNRNYNSPTFTNSYYSARSALYVTL